MPGTARPNARVPTWRGSTVSPSTRTISVIPQSSIMGKPKRFSNAACSSGSMPAPMPNRTLWRRSCSPGGSFSSTGAITPR